MTVVTPPPVIEVPAALQWSALSARSIRASIREGDVVLGFAAPLVFFVCFYVPLHESMERSGVDYAQYLVPLIVIQAMFFAAMFAGDRAAREVVGGMGTRLRSMPVQPWIPPAARLSANVVRACFGLVGSVVIGALFGFRFHGVGAAGVFVVLTLAFGAVLVVGADALGTVTRNPQVGATVLFVPQLLLLMTSTGFVPAEGFPGWIQPFVRNQPVSILAGALNGLSDGRFSSEVRVAMIWIVAAAMVVAVVSVRVERERP